MPPMIHSQAPRVEGAQGSSFLLLTGSHQVMNPTGRACGSTIGSRDQGSGSQLSRFAPGAAWHLWCRAGRALSPSAAPGTRQPLGFPCP